MGTPRSDPALGEREVAGGGGTGLSGGAPGGTGRAGVTGTGVMGKRGPEGGPLGLTRPFSPQQCGVISEHTKKMCTR